MHKANQKLFYMILAMLACAFIAQVLQGCNNGDSAVNPTSSTKLQVINTSIDAGPVAMFINNYQLGKGSDYTIALRTYFRYASTPVYYGVGTGLLTLQLRTPVLNTNLSNDTITTVSNKSYSLYLLGLNSIDSLSTILLNDNSILPALGNGKIRFLNASPRTPALDVYVNGTLGFTKVKYQGVTNFIEVPAGVYDFKLTANGAPTSILTDLPRITIQDGNIYTLYSKGLVGRIDTAAISLNLVTTK